MPIVRSTHRSSTKSTVRMWPRAIGRPKALDTSKADLARRMHASGERASTIAIIYSAGSFSTQLFVLSVTKTSPEALTAVPAGVVRPVSGSTVWVPDRAGSSSTRRPL